MAAAAATLSLPSCSFVGLDKTGSGGSLRLTEGFFEQGRVPAISFRRREKRDASIRSGRAELKISCCFKKNSERFHHSVDAALILKKRSEDVLPYLNGRCIYLVGMMGSGKSTVGKILSEVLGYSFFDSDKLVEQAVGISSVAQIFEQHSETFFRDNESKVLKDLSSMSRLVVATGGGAVIRPINWKHMNQGVTAWLDVPLEALAKRIAAVGTASRPLLHQEPGDPYTKAFKKLTALSEQRGKAYANAHARVSLEDIALRKGHGDVSALTPTDIALEECFTISCSVVLFFFLQLLFVQKICEVLLFCFAGTCNDRTLSNRRCCHQKGSVYLGSESISYMIHGSFLPSLCTILKFSQL
ncbi:shikimate kinase 3, chloroplastic-like isoform X2 [Zingiber officinale]|uniref:shikimate kinase 3, chloroplastic-like isoform X2 n=1 Tax=Zingiber officinale TaxID=94328 RepID=UPI001C4AE6D6|nr:shikimate kinase 3, chloroplastic-like isoform X2 [Zingiber officinale]